MGKVQRAVCGGGLVEHGQRGWATSAQHHQGDGPASSLGHLSMGTEQCAVVFFLTVETVVEVDPEKPE